MKENWGRVNGWRENGENREQRLNSGQKMTETLFVGELIARFYQDLHRKRLPQILLNDNYLWDCIGKQFV